LPVSAKKLPSRLLTSACAMGLTCASRSRTHRTSGSNPCSQISEM
jgi:hypothetical protein